MRDPHSCLFPLNMCHALLHALAMLEEEEENSGSNHDHDDDDEAGAIDVLLLHRHKYPFEVRAGQIEHAQLRQLGRMPLPLRNLHLELPRLLVR